MFEILNDKTFCLTRGDIAKILVSANLQDGQAYKFAVGDVVRFRVYEKKNCGNAVVDTEAQSVTISLNKEDNKIGELINKPVDYWYEIEVNPDTDPQAIIGYDLAGEKIFRLYPEGRDSL